MILSIIQAFDVPTVYTYCLWCESRQSCPLLTEYIK